MEKMNVIKREVKKKKIIKGFNVLIVKNEYKKRKGYVRIIRESKW